MSLLAVQQVMDCELFVSFGYEVMNCVSFGYAFGGCCELCLFRLKYSVVVNCVSSVDLFVIALL